MKEKASKIFNDSMKRAFESAVGDKKSFDDMSLPTGMDFKSQKLLSDDDEYFGVMAYSSSYLKAYDKNPSMHNCRYYPQKQIDKVASKSQKIGSIIHKIILEGWSYTDFTPLLTPKEKLFFPHMLKRLLSNKVVHNIIKDAKEREKPIYWKEKVKGKMLSCKAKIDLLTKQNDLFELKTISTLNEFKHQIDQYRYDLQMSFYKRAVEVEFGIKVNSCAFIVLETTPPYDSHIFEIDDSYLDRGENGGYIRRFEVFGWRELLEEIHFNPRNRFEKAVTVLTLEEE